LKNEADIEMPREETVRRYLKIGFHLIIRRRSQMEIERPVACQPERWRYYYNEPGKLITMRKCMKELISNGDNYKCSTF
jgi:hypothetical protein